MLSCCDECGLRRWRPAEWSEALAVVRALGDPDALEWAREMRRRGAECWGCCACGAYGFALDLPAGDLLAF